MHILYFNNGSGLGTAKSGGTTRLIETASRLIRDGVKISIVTTVGAHKLFNTEKLAANYFIVRASLFGKVERNNFERMWSYVLSAIHSVIIFPRLPACDIVYSPSDYFCDVIPAVAYKIFHPKVAFVAMVHHLCRPPGQRKGNIFFNRISYIGQQLSFLLISRFADQVFVYDTPEGKAIGDYFLERGVVRVKPVANGVPLSVIDRVPAGENRFDVCFVGGLRVSKGVYDLIPIWNGVIAHFPMARLAIVGEGAPSVTEDFRSRLSAARLMNNVTLLGALPSLRLYEVMKASRMFLSTSHEEGWGIAICEALACGLPVVAFSLPAFGFLEGQIDEAPLMDHDTIVKKLVSGLSNTRHLEERGILGRLFIERFDWDLIALEELDSLQSISRHDFS
jgi:glycosyltransferase involved in cell wall biosynthesis